MRLLKVTIEGYRSIRHELPLILDQRVTVILGANDHGKTNILDAIRHLNPDTSYDEDDINWDVEDQPDRYPALAFELGLDEVEREELARLDTALRLRVAAGEARQQAADTLSELVKPVALAREAHETAVEAVNSAQTALDQARTAMSTVGDTPESRQAVADAESAAKIARQEAGRHELEFSRSRKRVDEASLRYSLADGRALQADELWRVTGVSQSEAEAAVAASVTNAVEAAEAAAQAAASALRRADAKAKAASDGVEKATAAGDAESLAKFQQEAHAAAAQASDAKADWDAKSAKAQRLARASASVALLDEGDAKARESDVPVVPVAKVDDAPTRLMLTRVGLKGSLEPVPSDTQPEVLAEFLSRRLPRVELIEPARKIPDSVSRTQLPEAAFVFMRGIFEYAGIQPDEWHDVFAMNDRTRMRLEAASAQLNDRLRASWSQGSKLNFALRHDSKSGRIDLLIRDPAIESRYARPSKRSSGFTHFFALKTILHGLQSEAPTSSYLWVFDEPGLFLHPDGQRDLIQVMETLALQNQVIYSTHSIFLANKNYPTRHRLVVKTELGTTQDSKPFISRWRSALDALGLSLPGTLLFASHVLLVEGDSDAILINATLRKLIELGRLDMDLNALAVIATGDAQNTDALIRILSEAGPADQTPTLGLLVDGDAGGKKRLEAVSGLISNRQIASHQLMDGTTTEDHVLGAKSLYIEALARYLAGLRSLDLGETLAKLTDSFNERFPGSKEVTAGLCAWSREAAQAIAGLDDKPSPVGVARAYAQLLEDTDPSLLKGHAVERGLKLATWIKEALKVPQQTLAQEDILETTP